MKKFKLLLSFIAIGLLSACSSASTPSSSGSDSSKETSSESSSESTSSSSEESSSSSTSDRSSSESSSTSSSSVHVHEYEAVVTEPTCTEEGFTTYTCSCGDSYIDDYVDALGHDYVGITCTRCGNKMEVSDGDVIEFGHYPQSLVKDEALISSLSLIEDGDNDGYIVYEGNEYFKSLGSDINGYSSSSTYYFAVEPIEWKYFGGMLIAEKIIDACTYYADGETERTIDGQTIYGNNYMYSAVRAYLNGLNGSEYSVDDFSSAGFLDKAFSEREQEEIEVTTVDNGEDTTYLAPNPYACGNTEDKIFLLSYQDAKNVDYRYSEETLSTEGRIKKYSDFAMFRGLGYNDESTGTGFWWLRSPYTYRTNRASGISTTGNLVDNYLVQFAYGLAPALNLAI